jgi:hypothetical protein
MAQDSDERDESITAARIAGQSVRALARQYGCSRREIEEAIERRLDYTIDNAMRLKAIKLDVARLEALMLPFFIRATRDKDVPSGTLCCKLLERRALLLGLDSPTRVDVVRLQVAEQPRSFDRIREAVFAVARRNAGYDAVCVLSDSDEDKSTN